MKKIDNKKIILSIFMILVVLIGFGINVYASDEDETINKKNPVTVDYLEQAYNSGEMVYVHGKQNQDLQMKSGGIIYCIMHTGNADQMSGKRSVLAKISIKGNVATNEKNNTSVTHKLNAMLAYVISLEDPSLPTGYVDAGGGIRQKAMWRIMANKDNGWFKVSKHEGSWITNVYNKLKNSEYSKYTWNCTAGPRNSKADALYKQAIKYAEEIENAENLVAEITGVTGNGVETSNTLAGPFTVSFKGELDKYSVFAVDEDITNQVKIVDGSGKETTIKSGQEFYIENKTNKVMTGMTIDVKSKEKVYGADLYILGRANAKGTAYVNSKKQLVQTHMGVKPYVDYAKDSTTINFKADDGIKAISGYVWLDEPDSKTNTYDEKFVDSEKKIAGVTVKLVDNQGKVLETTTTDSKGEYVFNYNLTGGLEKYHIEYDYSYNADNKNKYAGSYVIEQNKKYVPVEFNDKDKSKVVITGSRALADEATTNSSVAYTDKNSKGYGLNYFYNCDGFFNAETSTLQYINLGLKELPNSSYSLYEDLDKVTINIKGYSYEYKYGELGNNFQNVPKVKWQNKDITGYSRTIYPSDIKYVEQNAADKLNVKVKYNIYMKNDTMTNIEDLYKEKALKVETLLNQYDTSRYTLNDSNWKSTGNAGEVKYALDIPEVGPGKTEAVSITFNVSIDKLKEILDSEAGIIEEKPTKAVSDAYHKYTRKDEFTGIESDFRTENEKKTADAPYLIFKLGQNREVIGTVFEDGKVSTNGEALGNGKYDGEDNVVEHVKVELMDISNNKVSHLYTSDEDGAITESDAVTYTNEDGEFSLAGMVPGEYYLRFTYPDGTTKIIGKDSVNFNDYKSTIVTSDNVKNAFNSDAGSQKRTWYKELDDDYSIAKDDLTQRAKYNNGEATNVYATSPYFSILVENVEGGSGALKEQYYTYGGFNLGIIEAPKTEIGIEKVISRIDLLNVAGNRIIGGNPVNPGNDPMTGVSDLDNKDITFGSTYVRVELPETELYGSDIGLTYKIRVINKSDINYYGEDYYWYGIKSDNLVGLNISEVEDALDNKLEFVDSNVTSTKTEVDMNGIKQQIIKLSELNETIYPERVSDKKVSFDFEVRARKKLGQEEDMTFINKARVSKLSNVGSGKETDVQKNIIRRISVLKNWAEAKNIGEATIVITPPTGLDKQSIIIYSAIGIVLLVGMATGIAIIKKKVV